MGAAHRTLDGPSPLFFGECDNASRQGIPIRAGRKTGGVLAVCGLNIGHVGPNLDLALPRGERVHDGENRRALRPLNRIDATPRHLRPLPPPSVTVANHITPGNRSLKSANIFAYKNSILPNYAAD